MKQILGNVEAILDTQVSGFHQYSLSEPVHLTYVSQNLCDMTGYRQEELLNEYQDLYVTLVHPADRDRYRDFIRELAQQEQTLTIQYRIISKDGKVKYVSDTASSGRLEDGTICASSVLSDITEVREEQDGLQFLNDTMPCGFLKYTCEKHPKVTYFNEQMLQILGFPDDPEERQDFLEMYKENIYLMIPMEQRRKFTIFLKRVYSQNSTIAGELVVQRCDGSKARIYGWVTKSVNEKGEEEFQTVCMDVTERYETTKARETERYLRALTEVYDRIFEYDFSAGTAKCLYSREAGTFSRMLNIPMQLKEGTDHYIENVIVEEDREAVRDFFRSLYQPEPEDGAERPPQINFRALSSGGSVKNYSGIFIRMSSSAGLFCCRDAVAAPSTSSLQAEGTVAFEVDGDKVKPLYASDNICKFFGYTREEWDELSEKTHSIRKFISRSGVPYDQFSKLLQQGEAEFDYTDTASGNIQRIKAVCSHMFANGSAAKYVMLYNVDPDAAGGGSSISGEVSSSGNQSGIQPGDGTVQMDIQIRTFGYFDVFVNGSPIAFRNKKSKELFALLVDRRGGYVSSEEAISYLWEDEPVNAVTLARYRKVAMRLKNILEEYGIADVVEAVDGKRRIVTEKVRCDFYDYLSNQEEFAHLFKGSYLTNYSWGENTLGELTGDVV